MKTLQEQWIELGMIGAGKGACIYSSTGQHSWRPKEGWLIRSCSICYCYMPQEGADEEIKKYKCKCGGELYIPKNHNYAQCNKCWEKYPEEKII